jgi:hypothetical protein
VILASQQCFFQIDKLLSSYILVLIPCAHLNSFLCNLICFVLSVPLLSMSFLNLVRKSLSLVLLMMNVPHEQMGCFRYSKICYFLHHFRRIESRFHHIYFVNSKEFLFVVLVKLIILLLFGKVGLAFSSSKNLVKIIEITYKVDLVFENKSE